MSKRSIQIQRPNDGHVHLRQGELLPDVIRPTTAHFNHCVIMPNTDPPILTTHDVACYKRTILRQKPDHSEFLPMMTFRITPGTTPNLVAAHKRFGTTIGKLYPADVTTNSAGGVTDFEALYPVFAKMREQEMILSLHGEMPGADPLEAERAFLPTLRKIACQFPELRIILEHVSTAEGVELVKKLDNVFATITPHHLWLTWQDVLESDGKTVRNPHLFCRPVANTEKDRTALIRAVTSSHNDKFFLGTDSAPHRVEDKRLPNPRPGIYSSLVAIQAVTEIFDRANCAHRLVDFLSLNFEKCYRTEKSLYAPRDIELVNTPWIVPENYNGIVPFLAGQTLQWQIIR